MGSSDSAQLSLAEARLGRVLRGKWRLDELLGIGGMAAVYSATHRNGKRVAVKVLRPEASAVPDVKSRFLREGYLANKVGHPGAVSILDDDTEDDGTVFLVMELLNGETLEQRWERLGNLPWEEALVIAYQALDVLGAAHGRGIIHRDIKPGNLFIDADNGVKVLDFGIARLHDVRLERSDTGYDKALGTPGFMPQEQARGRSEWVDARSDVFGVGATLFAVLTGRYVHEAETPNEQLMLAMTMHAPPVGEHAPGLPQPVAALIDRALSFERDDRFPDAHSMRSAIAEAYQQCKRQSIGDDLKIRVPVRSSRSVRPDAPTVAAGDVSSTNQPVSRSRGVRDSPRLRLPLLVWGLGGGAVVAAVGWALFQSRSSTDPPGSMAGPSALVAAENVSPPRKPEPPAGALASSSVNSAPAPAASEALAAPIASEQLASPAATPKGTRSAGKIPRTGASAKPAVDIFGQRK